MEALAAEEESRGFSLASTLPAMGKAALSTAAPQFAVCRTAGTLFGGKEEQAARVRLTGEVKTSGEAGDMSRP